MQAEHKLGHRAKTKASGSCSAGVGGAQGQCSESERKSPSTAAFSSRRRRARSVPPQERRPVRRQRDARVVLEVGRNAGSGSGGRRSGCCRRCAAVVGGVHRGRVGRDSGRAVHTVGGADRHRRIGQRRCVVPRARGYGGRGRRHRRGRYGPGQYGGRRGQVERRRARPRRRYAGSSQVRRHSGRARPRFVRPVRARRQREGERHEQRRRVVAAGAEQRRRACRGVVQRVRQREGRGGGRGRRRGRRVRRRRQRRGQRGQAHVRWRHAVGGRHASTLGGQLELLGVDLLDDGASHGLVERLGPAEGHLLGHDHLSLGDQPAPVADTVHIRAVALVSAQQHRLVVVLAARTVGRAARRCPGRRSRSRDGRGCSGRRAGRAGAAAAAALHRSSAGAVNAVLFASAVRTVRDGQVQLLPNHDWHIPPRS